MANAAEDAAATDAVLRRFEVRAAALVELHWPWIQRVAKALSREGELSAAAIDELRWTRVRAEEQTHGHVSGGR